MSEFKLDLISPSEERILLNPTQYHKDNVILTLCEVLLKVVRQLEYVKVDAVGKEL